MNDTSLEFFYMGKSTNWEGINWENWWMKNV